MVVTVDGNEMKNQLTQITSSKHLRHYPFFYGPQNVQAVCLELSELDFDAGAAYHVACL